MTLAIVAAVLLVQDDPKATAELVSARTYVRPGEQFTVGIRIQTSPGWHVYYQNAGDSGMPTDVKWSLPKNWRPSEILWPAPHVFGEDGLLAYGYEGETFLLSRITVPKNSPKGKQTLSAEVSWLACDEICIQGSAKVSTQVTVSTAVATNKTWQPKLAEAWGRVPAVDRSWTTIAEATPTGYVLNIIPPVEELLPNSNFVFVPSQSSVVEHKKSHPITKQGSSFMLHLNKSEYATGSPKRLTGVLLVPKEGEPKALKIDIPVQYRGESS
jgi:DsbC/DsbD-like thiol-disulfide interchange protein